MQGSRATRAAILLGAVAFGVSCTKDAQTPMAPKGPSVAPSQQKSFSNRPGTCFTAATLQTLIKTMLGAGRPELGTALAKLASMIVFVAQNKIPQAQAAAQDLIAFLESQISPNTPASQQAQIQQTINAILCYVGLPTDTFVLLPSTTTQTVVTSDGNSGMKVPPGAITVPTVFTFTPITISGLITKLDQYPTYESITTSAPFTGSVVVAICLGVNVDPTVFARLKLGHQASYGFEIPPTADAGFLNCPATVGSTSHVPGWLRSIGDFVLPKTLYARTRRRLSGGIGGSLTELSPVGAVDYGLFATGGVGGSLTELQRTPVLGPKLPSASTPTTGSTQASKLLAPSNRSNSLNGDGSCNTRDAVVGTPIDSACRPIITIKTHNGTILTNVPVQWATTPGNGTVAPVPVMGSPAPCGAYGTSASTTTDVNGQASICWILGQVGQDTATATPSAGGDAPQGVTFIPPSLPAYATGLAIPSNASATGATVPFNGSPVTGSGSCSNQQLSPVLTYTASDGTVSSTAPTNVGTYTLTVTCGAGNPLYNAIPQTAQIVITGYTPTVTVTCSSTAAYTGADQSSACTATATGANSANLGSVPVTFVPTPPIGATSYAATGTFTATGNYSGATGGATLVIAKATSTTTVTCTAGSTYTSLGVTPCTATATGAGGLSASVTPVNYTNNISAGTNTASASATYAGDANHTGSTGSANFSIGQAGTTTSLSCPSSAAYTGAVQNPCTASYTGAGLGTVSIPMPSYSPSPVKDVNTYTANASYAGDANHTGSNAAQSNFMITQAQATATAGSGAMQIGAQVPTLPCGVTGLFTGDGGKVTCTTAVPATILPGLNVTTPNVSQSSPLDYLVSKVNGTLTATYVQSGCFASPIMNPKGSTTASYNVKQGTNVTVKCRLVDGTGRPIVTAHGNLLVQDVGSNALGTPVTLFSNTNVFTAYNDGDYDSDDGVYTYVLSTKAAKTSPTWVSGHYYFVTAAWDDGTTTTGWFYLK